jgi:hypothetical protein
LPIQKNFTKKQFEVKPAGKSETASWENFISLLEKYFFSVEKLFFSNWALSARLPDAFLFLFTCILPPFVHFPLLRLLSINAKKVLRFLSLFRHKNKRNIFITLTQISPIPQMLLLFREIREIRVRNNVKH